MFYMKAEKHNGRLELETISSFPDDAEALETCKFLKECLNLDDQEACFGVVDSDTYDVLIELYTF